MGWGGKSEPVWGGLTRANSCPAWPAMAAAQGPSALGEPPCCPPHFPWAHWCVPVPPPPHLSALRPSSCVCPSVCESVCPCHPPPSTPGHCLVPRPPRGVPCPHCLCGGDHTRVTPPRAMLGVPGVAALPRPPALQPHAKGGRSGAPSCCQAASAHCVPQFPPFLVGGWNSVSLPAKCFETHLPPQQPGSGQWGPPPGQRNVPYLCHSTTFI